MKISTMKCCMLPKSKHSPGKLTTFGRPCPEVPQHEPKTPNDIQAHKMMAGGLPGHPR